MKLPQLLSACVAASALCGAGQAVAQSANAYANANPNAAFNRGNGSTGSTGSSSTGIVGSANTAKLDLLGVVASNCTIAITPTAKASSLDLQRGETDTVVGTVTENCSSTRGYTVSITSQNGGQLRSGGATAPLVNYSARYDNATGSLAASGLDTRRNQASFNYQRSLLVSLPANPQVIAGSYSDSVTFVIAAR